MKTVKEPATQLHRIPIIIFTQGPTVSGNSEIILIQCDFLQE